MGSCMTNSRPRVSIERRSYSIEPKPHKYSTEQRNNSNTLQSETTTGASSTHDEALDVSTTKRQLMESRKLSHDYTQIPNKIHSQQTVLSAEEVSGLIGLTNLGNTCFFNSALQCLLNTPPLVDYFMNDLHKKELNVKSVLGSKGAVTTAFANLCKQYWSTEDIDAINPKELLRVISDFASQFAQGTQEDCHEFLAFLLDMIHEDLNRVHKKPYIEGKDYYDNKLEEHAFESWRNYLLRNKSIIVDLFQGQSKSTLKCLRCGLTSHKFEPFMYLSLPIPETHSHSNIISLHDCLEEYSKEERLEGDEKWHCPRCKTAVESTKKLDIWKLPNILIIHLKRFEFTRERQRKIRTFVDFPYKDLNLQSVVAGVQRDKPMYDLYAVSNHEGSLGGGHYYTFAKNRDDKLWYAYNDAEVSALRPDQIVTPAAYLMFFSKTSVNTFKRQTISKPEAWPHLLNGKNRPSLGSPTDESLPTLKRQRSRKMSVKEQFDMNPIYDRCAAYNSDLSFDERAQNVMEANLSNRFSSKFELKNDQGSEKRNFLHY